jgi:hypothetical protein
MTVRFPVDRPGETDPVRPRFGQRGFARWFGCLNIRSLGCDSLPNTVGIAVDTIIPYYPRDNNEINLLRSSEASASRVFASR